MLKLVGLPIDPITYCAAFEVWRAAALTPAALNDATCWDAAF
jgi:hypothetical protein